MKRLVIIALGLVVAMVGVTYATGVEKEVGGEGTKGNTNPYWPAKAAMRFQCMWLQSELDTAGTVAKIEFKFHSYVGSPPSQFGGYKVILCHTSKTELTNTFQSNYDFKTPFTVYDGTLTIPAGLNDGDWFTVCEATDTFNYNNRNNMLMEVVWTSGEGADKNLFWITGRGQPGRLWSPRATATTGTLLAGQGQVARITFGNIGVEPTSLGRVKSLYR